MIVASDGSADGTVDAARAAGADQVLDLPRGGKVRAQDAAVERSRSEILAFSDANSFWAPDALRRLVAPFADPAVGYVCGRVDFTNDEGPNQEGLYWRYELALRVLESRLAGVTAGNGAIYATRRATYFVTEPPMSHDISFPFRAVKRGYRALYAPDARAEEKMVPSIEGEFARRRRMMRRGLGVVLLSGLLSPRGYPPLYALQVVSHRLLRVLTPLLHLLALGSNAGLARRGRVYAAAMAAQAAVLAAAALGPVVPARPARVAYYYVLAMAAYAAGIADWLRAGTPQSWEKAEGTR